MLMLSATLYLILLAEGRPYLVQFAALPLAFSLLMRPTNLLPLGMLTIFIFLEHRKYFLKYLFWSAMVLVPFVLFSMTLYDRLLPPYYLGERFTSPGRSMGLLNGFAGTLISPSRGLLIFSPIFLLSILGAAAKMRTRNLSLLDCALAGTIGLHWIGISLFPAWWGGHTFGPRLFSDMTPFLMYFLISGMVAVVESSGWRRPVLVSALTVLILASFFIHYRGATSRPVWNWNRKPVGIREAPERVWDWNDIQFLREP